MKTNHKVGDIISYPVPGVCVGQCDKNTVNKDCRIIKIYDNIICEDNGIIVDMEVLDCSIIGTLSGKIF
jgi:hypothetical protein